MKNCSKKTQCNISEYFHSVCIVPDIAISETIISIKILSKKWQKWEHLVEYSYYWSSSTTVELLKQFNLERKYFANTLWFFFIIVFSLGSTEVYIGYDVDTTVTNYRLRTLSGQLQSYENFFSYNMNSATWHCVSMYSSAWFAEKCDEDYHFLCSNLSNILGTFLKDYINTMILFIYIYISLWW